MAIVIVDGEKMAVVQLSGSNDPVKQLVDFEQVVMDGLERCFIIDIGVIMRYYRTLLAREIGWLLVK